MNMNTMVTRSSPFQNKRTQRGTSRTAFNRHHLSCPRLVLLVALVAAAGGLLCDGAAAATSATTAAAAPSPPHPRFRCFRPFASLDKFAPSSMHRRDNCEFQFVRVDDARVDVECSLGNATEKDEDRGGGCYATLSIDLAVTDQKLIEHELPEDVHEDVVAGRVRPHYHPYYTLELHAMNHSRITYKGFDGLGYDMCCEFLNTSAAHCEWENVEATIGDGNEADRLGSGSEDAPPAVVQRRQTIRHCAVTNPATPSGLLVTGSVRRPLHKIVAGDWEVRWVLRRGRETVGRLIVPFQVTEAMLNTNTTDATHHHDGTTLETDAATPASEDVMPSSSSAAAVVKQQGDDATAPEGVENRRRRSQMKRKDVPPSEEM